MLYRDEPQSLIEVKFKGDGTKPLRFAGRASTFNRVDQNGDLILPGAFTKTLAARQSPVMMLKDHRPSFPIGKWLSIEQDAEGLFVEGELTPGNSIAEDAAASLRHGALRGLSIGYRVPPPEHVAQDAATGARVLKQLDLVEISTTTMPADLGAGVLSIKSIEEMESLSNAEDLLREAAGFSRMEAKAFMRKLRELRGEPMNAGDGATLREADVSESISELVVKTYREQFGLHTLRIGNAP